MPSKSRRARIRRETEALLNTPQPTLADLGLGYQIASVLAVLFFLCGMVYMLVRLVT
jgi:hypothetical protein